METLKPLLLKIYEAASMQRWNDQLRPVILTELDKQAHKMIVAYLLAKIEQKESKKVIDWIKIIEGGLFDFFQRIIITDLKPPVFYKIKEDMEMYSKLNEWVYNEISPLIYILGSDFCNRFKKYFFEAEDTIDRKINGAAHFYATKWEFNIIERVNPKGYLIEEISSNIWKEQEKYRNLDSVKELLTSKKLTDFINMCGQLRFQIRWSHIDRIPKTSVLGHMLIVAIFSLIFSYLAKLDKKRCINNYFTGLFHDLPEVLTRDIINPVKSSVKGLDRLIKKYEKDEMDKIYKLLPPEWHDDICMFTKDEFSDTEFRDGKLVKAADDLAALIEAYLSLKNGIQNEYLLKAKEKLIKYYKDKKILGISFGEIYQSFCDI